MNIIDFGLLDRAQHQYDAQFTRVEVPWWVTAEIVNATKPTDLPESNNYLIVQNQKYLIASGEQGLLYLANKGHLPAGFYQTVTPCWRNEAYDATHSKQFMKLELMQLYDAKTFVSPSTINDDVMTMAKTALSAMKNQLMKYALADSIPLTFPNDSTDFVRIEETRPPYNDPAHIAGTRTYDIIIDVYGTEVELGSYGARRTAFATWVYGTGIAEPRFSKMWRHFKSIYLGQEYARQSKGT